MHEYGFFDVAIATITTINKIVFRFIISFVIFIIKFNVIPTFIINSLAFHNNKSDFLKKQYSI